MTVLEFFSCIDLINLLHTSTFFQYNILDSKLFKYWDWAEKNLYCKRVAEAS